MLGEWRQIKSISLFLLVFI